MGTVEAFQVRTPLEIPETARQGYIAVFFAHRVRRSGAIWAVGARTEPDADLLGMITLARRGQDDAADAAVRWIGDHRAAEDLALVRAENVCDRYREKQQADFSLTRFTIAGPRPPPWTAGRCRRVCPVSPACPLDLGLRG
ncbi:hypothetical protein [Streptomyces barringtoniae]|uniref:hypothetical protein n=1 Tax=Streptomyces barringtoniae TaxID=2892029 RepID=UPI001E46220C|nr:hypothetical protein [Streptomyces barringtoniae]MCC5476071.1 hypothetical protein [Streptomyces barringtoniae]